MKIRLSELRSLIREEIQQLGKYAFADERRTPLPEKEPDTELESDAFKQLSKQILWSANMSPESVEILRAGLADGSYSDILKEPTVSTVYRGILISKDEASLLFQKLGIDPIVADEFEGDEIVSGIYTQKKTAESWTTSPSIAYKFATASMPPGKRTVVVLVADVMDNPGLFLSGPDGFYKLMSIHQKSDEDEILSLGSIRVNRVVWSTFAKTSKKMNQFVSS